MEDQREIQASVHEADGSLWAEVADCPGLYASGATLDELVEALGEAWLLYHDVYPADQQWAGAICSLTLRAPEFV
ncbi:MAG TPA: type II toxin-antitoxin system HicB family antitoxin [Solirubrobacteraceae bacterium]|nr:type II toxin-antitoxin system HicB family antitoxin [Solirubrobacteraceae bacterium]